MPAPTNGYVPTKEAVKHVTHERRTAKNACIYNRVCNCKRMDVTYLTASLVMARMRVGCWVDHPEARCVADHSGEHCLAWADSIPLNVSV